MTIVLDRRALLKRSAAGAGLLLFGAGASPPLVRGASNLRDWAWLEGRWTVQHQRLRTRLAQDTRWDEFAGTSSVWLTMGGLGTIDDNILDLPSGPYRALGIRAFDPKRGKWAIWWLDGRNSTRVDPPVLGGFTGNEGEFLGKDTFEGKPILVRFRWHETDSLRPHWDQAFSADNGHSWEVNWRNFFTRTAPAPAPLPLVEDRPRDFDFLAGSWRVKHRRLRKRLVGSTDWDVFDGTLVNWPVLGGLGNVGDNVMNFPSGTVRGVGFRAYDPASSQWFSWWLDTRNPSDIGVPLRGRLGNGSRELFSEEMIDGRRIYTRAIWSNVTARSARWEQASSLDGKTWEINWTSELERA